MTGGALWSAEIRDGPRKRFGTANMAGTVADRRGHIAALDSESTTTSELLQAHLPTSKVVKAFNHIYAAALTTDGKPHCTSNRRALAIAGDDAAAKATVAKLIDEFGVDAVDIGPLKESWRIQRDTTGCRPRRTAAELRADLAALNVLKDSELFCIGPRAALRQSNCEPLTHDVAAFWTVSSRTCGFSGSRRR